MTIKEEDLPNPVILNLFQDLLDLIASKITNYGTVANQLFRRIFRNSKFFGTHVHLGTLTFQKILNHKNFLEKLDLRQRHYVSKHLFKI